MYSDRFAKKATDPGESPVAQGADVNQLLQFEGAVLYGETQHFGEGLQNALEHTHTHTCMHTHAHTYMQAHICAYTQMCIHTNIAHTHTHTHIPTQTHLSI